MSSLKNMIVLVVVLLLLAGCGAGWLFSRRPDLWASGGVKRTLPEAGEASYDLIVAGSDPEGIAAAVSGARNGLRTLLVDTRPEPGGLMTRGWLNNLDMNYGPDGEILNKGMFWEFYRQIEGDSFDPDTADGVFRSLLGKEKNLEQLYGVLEITPLTERAGEKIFLSGVQVVLPSGRLERLFARRIIDATQDADLAAAAGVPYTVGLSDCGRPAERIAVTLIFKLKGVGEKQWQRLRQAIAEHGEPHTGANERSAWGFAKTMKGYRPANSRLGVRGLNLGRTKGDQVLINALHIFGVDPLSAESRKEARILAEQEIPRLIEYLKKNIPGLEDANLTGTAPELYVRDSRHILGLYRLSVNDIMENRDFWDRIAFGSYPVDIQATGPHFTGDVIGKPVKYAIPFRCLVPREVENLLVVGRSASFDSLAAGSARVIPVGMATGQAAGAAAALSIEKGISFREMSGSPEVIAELQNRLNSQGMELQPFQAPISSEDHWAYPGLKFMRQWGLASGGYTNNYRLDEEMKEESFRNCLWAVLRINGLAGSNLPPVEKYPQEKKLTLERAAQIMCAFQGRQLSPEQAYRHLKEKGFWESVVLDHVRKEGKISRGAGYMLVKRFVENYREL
ncbi:MAG: FAD-dependent oxidoreductase [Armatimonadetes bacterium]|nr:FAD-dependent oxidoreductase [Armatimonadota bacterium]